MVDELLEKMELLQIEVYKAAEEAQIIIYGQKALATLSNER